MATVPFATIDDLATLWREPSENEYTKAETLLGVVSDILRDEAHRRGKDLDVMLKTMKITEGTLKSVVVDITARTLMTSTRTEPMTQYSQSALGYSVSGTFLSPGGGVFVKKSELARLGLKRQQVGGVPLWDV